MLKLPQHPRAILAIAVLMVAGSASAAEPKIVPDVVYGHKDGMALTFDVIEPEAANGASFSQKIRPAPKRISLPCHVQFRCKR